MEENVEENTVRIGFDISQTCETKSGTGFFADQLIRALADIDKENEYVLFPHFYDYRPIDMSQMTRVENENFQPRVISDFSDNTKEIRNLDIVHSNNFRFPQNTRAKKVVTIYDVCFLEHPEYTTEANRLFCYKGTLDTMIGADKIIAISSYTKQRLLHYFPMVEESKIEVVYCGNRDTLQRENIEPSILDKFHLQRESFFLSVGTIEPRKNYGTLLKAYSEYRKRSKNPKKLCIAGGYGWLENDFQEKIEKMNLSNEVIVTRYVSDMELANLYRYCYSFVYTSWYEGFGMPVLEAMNFRKPVIASNVTSIPEIVGRTAILIEPHIVSQIADAMESLETDTDLYDKLGKEGYERAKFFSWKKAATDIMKIYFEIYV